MREFLPQGYSSESLVACRGLELNESENPGRAREKTQAEIPERGNQSGVLVTLPREYARKLAVT